PGSPHIHALLWLEGAPVLGKDSEEEFIALADELIRTDIPDPKEDPELHELVTRLQIHRHTHTCQKLTKPRFKLSEKDKESLTQAELKEKNYDAHCRFEYRRPPCETTRLHHALPRLTKADLGRDDSQTSAHSASSAILMDSQPHDASMQSQSSHATLLLSPSKSEVSGTSPSKSEKNDSMCSVESTANEGAHNQESSEAPPRLRRILSLMEDKSIMEKRFQTASIRLEMKRKATDGYTNNYNSALLRLWRANIDVQLVTNTFAACTYICSYISKSEKELGETMVEVLRSMPEGTSPIQRLRKLANAFVGARSVSAQEAIHRIIGLNMVEKSRLVQFLMTGFPKNRHRMLKPRAQRQKLDRQTATVKDLFVDGPLQKYEMRDLSVPEVARMSFATFCAYYEGNTAHRGPLTDDQPIDDPDADLRDKEANSDGESQSASDNESAMLLAGQDAHQGGDAQASSSAVQKTTDQNLPREIKLLGPDGKTVKEILIKRSRKKILRFCGFHREDQTTEFFYGGGLH
ncbi:MAG: hypothetical protein AAF357_16975, partial [Verrucomicrobiota bacterium]